MDKLRTSGAMTLEEIDRLLVAWRANLSMSSQNLLALDDLTTYKRLTGGNNLCRPTLTGETARRVPPALDDIAQLFDNLQVLTGVIDKAARLRETMPRVFAADHARSQIEELLTGNSVQLPPVQTPLAQRGLLSQSEIPSAVSPSFLLDVMTRTFDAAKKVILDVDAAWSRLEPDLAVMTGEAIRLAQISASLGENQLPELASLQSRITEIQHTIETDPLGAGANVRRDVTPLLERARARVDSIISDRDRLQNLLAEARLRLTELKQTHAKGIESLRICREQIENPVGLILPLAEQAPAELSAWLDTLEATFREGRMKAAQVGLSRWSDAATAALSTASMSLKSSSAPVELLAELRGRFAAQKSRAQACAARGITLDNSILLLEAQASQLLDVRVVSLEKASDAVSNYEAKLRAALAR